ncbi:MAG TPA: MobF family relaxase [Burkholderiaceae bacterium]|nr:MobF family relaxase [Burkholderiaceae bacterium]
MLSIANVSASAEAAHYYEQADDYYSQGRSPSAWSGRCAQALGLSGAIEPQAFQALLQGRLPDGSQLHRGGEGAGRRGGTDLTFSAPKSVSIQAYIAGDARLLQAHETALARTLADAERLAACRVTQGRQTRVETTGAWLVAQFRHDTSRERDPQLHTHCVVLNLTQRADGVWRALSNEERYRHKHWLGAHYRAELARQVRDLGYAIRKTHMDGRFELAHVSDEPIRAFSQRSQAIEQALAQRGLTRAQASARQREIATLQTRQAKQDIDRAALHRQWRERAQALGLRLEEALPVPPAKAPDLGRGHDPQRDAAIALAAAAGHLFEREAVTTRRELETAALHSGVGRVVLSDIRAAIERAQASGELRAQDDRFTTPAAQQRERDILALESAARGTRAPVMTRQALDRALAQPEAARLNDEQRALVAQVLGEGDGIQGVQGLAGTGKTTALALVNGLGKKAGLRLIGLAPSAAAARELQASGIDSETLASLAARAYAGLNDKTLLVLDEAGMVGAGAMHALLSAASLARARVLLVGDVRQLKAIDAGRPFAQLQAAGMRCARLSTIQRQRDATLKGAVELAARGQVRQSLQKLGTHIREEIDSGQRHRRIARDYLALSEGQRRGTLIVAGTHAARESINRQVRAALGLQGAGVAVTSLSPKPLTGQQARSCLSYDVGDWVRAQRGYGALGLSRGDLACVVDKKPGLVVLQRADGQRVDWRPVQQSKLTAFTAREIELAVGDAIRFTHNDRAAGWINGDKGQVVGIEEGALIVRKPDGAELRLAAQAPVFADSAYCQTVHAAQGQTCERVMIEAVAGDALASQALYYVSISRARQEAVIYTDDRDMLAAAFGRADDKSAALDIDGEGEGEGTRPELGHEPGHETVHERERGGVGLEM